MMNSSYGFGRYTASEEDVILGGLRTWRGDQPLGIIVCHGSGSNAADCHNTTLKHLRKIAIHATLHVGDLGFQTWGSDLVVTRIGEAADYLRNNFGVEKLALFGISMGGCSALNYALRFPDEITCVALSMPLLSLEDVRSNPWLGGRWPEIDAIYGSPPANDYTGHSPVGFAADLDPKMPIKMWTTSDDPLARPPTADAFVRLRPQTERVDVGPLGHSDPGLAAAMPSITRFLVRHLKEAS